MPTRNRISRVYASVCFSFFTEVEYTELLSFDTGARLTPGNEQLAFVLFCRSRTHQDSKTMYERVRQLRDEDLIRERIGMLVPGATVHLKLNMAGRSGTFAVDLVGVMPDQYIVVSVPADRWVQHRAVLGSAKLIVRYLLEEQVGEITAFTSSVLATLPAYRLLLIEFPYKVEILQLREAPRVQLEVPVVLHMPEKVHIKGRATTMHGKTDDLSRSGCRIRFAPDLTSMIAKGDILHLEVPVKKQKIKLFVEVRNVRRQDTGSVVGMQFCEVSKAALEKVLAAYPVPETKP